MDGSHISAEFGAQPSAGAAAWTRKKGVSSARVRGFGWSFNADKGQLSFFTPLSITTYRANPPQVWYRSSRITRWIGCHGYEHFTIGDLLSRAARQQARLRWVSQYDLSPEDAVDLDALASFGQALHPSSAAAAAPFGRGSWLLYAAMTRVPSLAEIAHDNAGLAMLAALTRTEKRRGFASLRAQCRRPRRDLLLGLGGPGSAAAVRIFAKLSPESATPLAVDELRRLCQTAPTDVRRLSHLPSLNLGAIDLLRCAGSNASLAALAEVAETHRFNVNVAGSRLRLSHVYRDTVEMLRAMDRRMPPIRSLEQLFALHREATDKVRDVRLIARVFPPPPLAPIDGIEPLTHSQALQRESREQGNCLGSPHFAQWCDAGMLYVYKMTDPERASIAVALDKRGKWGLYEQTARFNRPLKAPAKRVVRRWLLQQGATASHNFIVDR